MLQQRPGVAFKVGAGVGAGLVITFLVIHILFPHSVSVRAAAADSLFWLVSIGAAVCLVLAARACRRTSPSSLLPWAVLATAQIFYAAGDVTWGILSVGFHVSSHPTAADGFYMMFYILFPAGLLLLPGPSLSRDDRLKLVLDLAIMMVASLLLFWVLLIRPALVTSQESGSRLLLMVAYLSFDLVLVFSLFRLLLLRAGLLAQWPVLLLALSGIVRVSLDALLGYHAVQSLAVSGGLDDVGWMGSYVLIGLAGIAQAEGLSRGTPGAARQPVRYGESPRTLYLPYFWAVGAYAILAWAQVHERWVPLGWLAVGVGCIFALTLLRQFVVIRENSGLAQDAQKEIAVRRDVEASLERARSELEQRVQERTADLARSNEALRSEMAERRRAEEALRQSEERYRGLAEAAHDMIFIVNRDGIVEYVNRFAAAQLGTTPQAIIGTPQASWFPPSTAERQTTELGGAIAAGEPHYVESTTRFPDGDLWLGTWLVPLKDPAGHPVAVLGISRDITEKRRAEEALRDSEERFRSLFLQSPDAIFVESYEGNVLDVNPAACRLHGMTREQLLRTNVLELVPPATRPTLREGYAKVVSGEWTHFESQSWTVAGASVPVDVRVSRITYGGKPALLFHVHDITERKRAEEERLEIERRLQHTQKLESLGVMAGGIAHDFNNLLMAILGNLDLAISDLPPSAPVRENLCEAEKASRRAAELCRQMLAYSGRGRFVLDTIDLNDVLADIRRMLEVMVSKKVVLRYEYAAGLPPIEGDVTQLRQVIMNLVVNSSEAIGDKSGVISVTTGAMACDSDYLKSTWLQGPLPDGVYDYVEVADTGCGMDRDFISKIFDPFFTTKFAGRGLGLAAVLGIVRAHRGAIKVDSEPGKGATFRVLFPISRASAAQRQDEETVRTLAKRMLERLGFTVLVAADGREALRVFQAHQHEVLAVILDLTMPHMDGVESFDALRRLKDNVRVILSSGYDEQDVLRRFGDRGLAAVIQKPYETRALAAKLKQILGQ